jgi:hypothetical protein
VTRFRAKRAVVPPTIETRLLILVCAVLETGTGLALLTLPRFAVRVLLGAELLGAGVATSRLCGVALVSVGLACWPESEPPLHPMDRRAIRALLVYNASATAYLAYLLILGGHRGILLVPAIVIQAVVAVLLGRTVVWSRGSRQEGA